MNFPRSFIAGLTFALLLCSLSPGQETINDPYEILGKYIEAIGGLEKVKAEKTAYFEGNLSVGQMQGIIRQWSESPIRKRVEVDLKIIKQTSGDNGRFSWEEDVNGKVQIKKDEETAKRRKLEELRGNYEHLNPNSIHFNVSYEGVEKVGDADCYVVMTTNNINDDYILEYINTSTFLMEKSASVQPDVEMHVSYADYRDINGVKHPFAMDMVIQPVGQEMSIRIDKYESNIEIDPSLFEPPGQDAQDYRFTEDFSAENIPFQFIGNHLYIAVNVNGKERLWCLDTGAGKSVIDNGYAAELGLEPEGNIKGSGAGNVVEISFVKMPPFSIEGIEFDEQTVGSIGIRKLFRQIGLDVVGILGYDFLSRFVVKVDYANEKLSFYHPDHFEYYGTGSIISAPLMGNTFSVPMTVDGKYSGKWSVDLGAGGNSFHYPFAEENKLLDLDGIDRIGKGAGGEFRERTSEFQTAEFGGYTVRKPLIGITREKGVGAFRRSDLIGNLGNTLLRHFVLYLDYAHQRIIVEEGDNFDHEFPRDKSGLQIWVNDEDNYEVRFASPGTPAEKAGFKQGDIVSSINGIDVERLGGYYDIIELLKANEGTKYKFSILRDGKAKEIELKLKELY
jgi:hypothetical protein